MPEDHNSLLQDIDPESDQESTYADTTPAEWALEPQQQQPASYNPPVTSSTFHRVPNKKNKKRLCGANKRTCGGKRFKRKPKKSKTKRRPKRRTKRSKRSKRSKTKKRRKRLN